MAEQRHTAGSWVAIPTSDTFDIYGRGQKKVARLYYQKSRGEERANARLIAAAPELLDVAIAAEYSLSNFLKDEETADAEGLAVWAKEVFLPMARAALAKAEISA